MTSVGTLVERTSRYVILLPKLPNGHRAEEARKVNNECHFRLLGSGQPFIPANGDQAPGILDNECQAIHIVHVGEMIDLS